MPLLEFTSTWYSTTNNTCCLLGYSDFHCRETHTSQLICFFLTAVINLIFLMQNHGKLSEITKIMYCGVPLN